MSGKKKKTKGKVVTLSEFLGSDNSRTSSVIVPPKSSSWADESEEYSDDKYYSNHSERIVLPTAPRTAMGPDIDPEKIPKSPPYTAYIANLPFEVEDEEIVRFFSGCKIAHVRLPKESESGRFKGFGYVEFETRQDLVEALTKNKDAMRGRSIRVDVAEGDGGNRRGGDHRGGRDEEPDRSGGVSNWRSDPSREESSFRDDRSPGRGGYDDRQRDRRGYGDRDRGYGDRDRGYGDRDRGYGDRDRGYGDRDRGYGDRDRGYGDRDRDRGGRGGFGDHYDSRDRGGRYGGGGGGRYDDDRRGGYRRDDERDQWRRGGGGGDRGGDREKNGDDGPRERPKLQLKPRTKPVEEKKDDDSTETAPTQEDKPSKAASIFGSAKPVDTASREQEIERKIKPASPPPVKKEVVPAANIFGAAKPVDTAAREREIEAKMHKTDAPKREEKSEERQNGQVLRSDREGGREEKKKFYSVKERREERNLDHKPSDRRQNERSSKQNDRESAPTPLRKGPHSKDSDVVLDVSNKFAFLSNEDEEEEAE